MKGYDDEMNESPSQVRLVLFEDLSIPELCQRYSVSHRNCSDGPQNRGSTRNQTLSHDVNAMVQL